MLLALIFDSFIELFVPFADLRPNLNHQTLQLLKSVAMSNEVGLKFGHKEVNGTNNSINQSNMSANSIQLLYFTSVASELHPFTSSKTFNLRAVWGGLLGRRLDEYMPKHG